MYNFEDVNRILAELNTDNVIEPIDDPSVLCDFYDWADVVGVDVDEWIPEEYTV
jgi:hypothetical protein